MSDELLTAELQGAPPELRVVLRGELDLHTAPTLRQRLLDAAAAGAERVVVDCRALEFVDSAGLRALLVARDELRSGSVAVVVADPSPAVGRVLDMTNLRASLTE